MTRRIALLPLSLLFLSVFVSAQASSNQSVGTAKKIGIPAASLVGNKLDDPTTQPAIVYLPAGYAEQTTKRYPVLYLLHGFSLHSILGDWQEVIVQSMNDFVLKNPDKAFIVVIPNGANKVDGSFYLDSGVGGNWEQYIWKDVVTYVDSHYRTIPNRRSRAVAGHSMGGFGTLRMLLLHADVFATGYAISPCCLDLQEDMTSANVAWRQVVKMHSVEDVEAAAAKEEFWETALAAFAFAANPTSTASLDGNLPYRETQGSLIEVPTLVSRWKSVMPLNLIQSHVGALAQADGIALDYGYEDEFSHIPVTSRAFGEKLLSLHIPIVVEGYHGDHNSGVPARIETRVIPFIADHLQFQK